VIHRGRPPKLRTREPGARGQTLVEAALVLPAMVLFLMGLFDLGRVVYAQHTITQDAREASRTGQVSPAYTAAQYQAIRNAALAMSPGVSLVAGDITGLAGTDCPTETDPVGGGSCFYPDGLDPASGARVVVNITVTVPLITPIISQIVGGSITVSTQSVSAIQ
jgi:Flp pilus assembly protein TadG